MVKLINVATLRVLVNIVWHNGLINDTIPCMSRFIIHISCFILQSSTKSGKKGNGAKSKAGKGKKGKQTSAADTTYKTSDNVLTSEESASATSNLSDKLSSTSESDEQ